MKQIAASLVVAFIVIGAARVANAQAGKPVSITDANIRNWLGRKSKRCGSVIFSLTSS